MSQVVTPLDPNSEHAKALAARWSRTLAVIEREISEAKPKRDEPVGRAA